VEKAKKQKKGLAWPAVEGPWSFLRGEGREGGKRGLPFDITAAPDYAPTGRQKTSGKTLISSKNPDWKKGGKGRRRMTSSTVRRGRREKRILADHGLLMVRKGGEEPVGLRV